MPLAQLEAKMILTSILQDYIPQPIPGYTPGFQPTITLRPKRHLQVNLLPTSSGDASVLMRRDDSALQERQGCRNALLGLFGLS